MTRLGPLIPFPSLLRPTQAHEGASTLIGPGWPGERYDQLPARRRREGGASMNGLTVVWALAVLFLATSCGTRAPADGSDRARGPSGPRAEKHIVYGITQPLDIR